MVPQAAQQPRTGLAKPFEVAEYLGVPEKTLTQWRYRGTGPKYSRVGRFVRYRWLDIDLWVDQNTSDPDVA